MTKHRILIIDNYDSFTFNLVQLFGFLKQEVEVVRNDTIDVEGIRRRNPDALVISPGPGRPSEAGICNQVIAKLHSELPILGVCLGHQCIGEVFGGKIVGAPSLMHGKTSAVLHKGSGLLEGLPSPLQATRYHSLIVEAESLPDALQVDAKTEDGIIMALRHKIYPVFGIQFHPESVMTESGEQIASNFLAYCGQRDAATKHDAGTRRKSMTRGRGDAGTRRKSMTQGRKTRGLGDAARQLQSPGGADARTCDLRLSTFDFRLSLRWKVEGRKPRLANVRERTCPGGARARTFDLRLSTFDFVAVDWRQYDTRVSQTIDRPKRPHRARSARNDAPDVEPGHH